MTEERRKSGLRDPFEEVRELDLESFTAPYFDILDEYKRTIYGMHKRVKNVAYLVTYVDEPDLFYIAFTTNKDKAKGIATKYFKESMHPNFINRGWRDKYNKCRACRCKELDKYAELGKVPIKALMRHLKVKVTCSNCGKGPFGYKDFSKRRCFLVEGEGGINEFSDGFVLCYECYREFFGDVPQATP